MNNNQIRRYPILILVRGLPGSGKSYIAIKLQESIGHDKVVLLDPDATDYESQEYKDHVKSQISEGVEPKLHAYRFLRAKAQAGIAARKIVIWNQPFTNLDIFNKMVANLQGHAAEHEVALPILVVEVEVDESTAKNRVEKRKQTGGHGPSDNTFTRFINDYRSFRNEGYNTVTAHGQDDVTVSVSSIMDALRELIQPDLV